MIRWSGPWRAVAGVLLAAVALPAAARSAEPEAGARSSDDAIQMYADAANYQNRKAFEVAVEEWNRFLKRFPDDPLASNARYYRGVCLIQLKQLDQAAESFQAVIDQKPDFDLLEDTYFNLGWCQYTRAGQGAPDLYAKAVESFAEQLKSFPEGKHADKALFYQGESWYAQGKRKEAAMAYGQLSMQHEESEYHSDALYALGVTLEEMAEFAKAAKAYDMFLQRYPSHELAVEVRMRKAETILQRGDPATAEQMFAEAAQAEGFAAADHALYRQAYCAARQEKFGPAAELYAQLMTRFPQSDYAAEAAMAAGRCYYRADQDEPAVQWFERVIAAEGPHTVEAAHWLSRIWLRQQATGQVLELTGKILPQAGDAAFAANLALDAADALYRTAGRGEEALTRYLEITQKYPQHEVAPQALYNAAFAALELRRFDQALQLADQFLGTYPQHVLVPDTLFVKAECQIQSKQYASAEELFRRLVSDFAEHPQRESWQVRRGLVLYLNGQPQQAIDWLGSVTEQIRSAEGKAEAGYITGLSHFRLEQYEQAARTLRRSLLASANWRQADEATLYLARSQFKLGQLDEARQTLEQLQASFPESAVRDQAAYRLGEVHYAAARYDEALKAYDQVLQQWPESQYAPFARYGKSWALMKSGQYAEAAESLTPLIDRQPPHTLRPDALLARGMCRRQLQQYPQAIADLDQFLQAQPDSAARPDALYERGLAESAASQPDKAVATYTQLLADYPQYQAADQVLYELAWTQKSADRETDANQTFARLAQEHPQSPLAIEARFHVAEQLYGERQYPAAAKLYQQVATESKVASLREKATFKWGWSQYQQNEYRAALDRFTAQLEAFPAGDLAADAHFMKAECLFKLEDYEAALPAFQQAAQLEPSTPDMAALTILHAAQSAGQLAQWQQVLELIEPIFERFPESPHLAAAYFERGRAQHKLDQRAQAIADYQQAVDRSRGEVGARAQFMIGEVHFSEQRYREAIKAFQRVMFRRVAQEQEPEIRPWQVKAAFEAARCAEVQIETAADTAQRKQRIDEAAGFYEFVRQQDPQSELGQQAGQRLAALRKL